MKGFDVYELLRHISDLLARWAEPGRLTGADRNGVRVLLERHAHRAKFELVTSDDCHIEVYFDLSETSRQYIDDLVVGVIETLAEHRADREARSTPVIINSHEADRALH